jgi:hypothetical protein
MESLSLAALLRRFCAEEDVGEGKGYDCADCGAGQGASRRLTLKKLPPVLSFQLKVSLLSPSSFWEKSKNGLMRIALCPQCDIYESRNSRQIHFAARHETIRYQSRCAT